MSSSSSAAAAAAIQTTAVLGQSLDSTTSAQTTSSTPALSLTKEQQALCITILKMSNWNIVGRSKSYASTMDIINNCLRNCHQAFGDESAQTPTITILNRFEFELCQSAFVNLTQAAALMNTETNKGRQVKYENDYRTLLSQFITSLGKALIEIRYSCQKGMIKQILEAIAVNNAELVKMNHSNVCLTTACKVSTLDVVKKIDLSHKEDFAAIIEFNQSFFQEDINHEQEQIFTTVLRESIIAPELVIAGQRSQLLTSYLEWADLEGQVDGFQYFIEKVQETIKKYQRLFEDFKTAINNAKKYQAFTKEKLPCLIGIDQMMHELDQFIQDTLPLQLKVLDSLIIQGQIKSASLEKPLYDSCVKMTELQKIFTQIHEEPTQDERYNILSSYWKHLETAREIIRKKCELNWEKLEMEEKFASGVHGLGITTQNLSDSNLDQVPTARTPYPKRTVQDILKNIKPHSRNTEELIKQKEEDEAQAAKKKIATAAAPQLHKTTLPMPSPPARPKRKGPPVDYTKVQKERVGKAPVKSESQTKNDKDEKSTPAAKKK